MRTVTDLTRDGDDFVARLDPSQASTLYEALSYVRRGDVPDAYLTVLLGADRDVVDGILERLRGPRPGPFEVRFRPEELHVVLSALTTTPAHFVSRTGLFSQEAFVVRLGLYRENVDALASAIVNAAHRAYEPRVHEVSE
jgi:hypothetical protein